MPKVKASQPNATMFTFDTLRTAKGKLVKLAVSEDKLYVGSLEKEAFEVLLLAGFCRKYSRCFRNKGTVYIQLAVWRECVGSDKWLYEVEETCIKQGILSIDTDNIWRDP